MRRLAASISASVGGSRVTDSRGVMTRSTPWHRNAATQRERALVDMSSGGHVLDRNAQRLEQRDLVVRAPPGDPSREQIAQLARDRVRPDRAVADRDEEIPGFVH